jgi:outer membrane immunogenic protein
MECRGWKSESRLCLSYEGNQPFLLPAKPNWGQKMYLKLFVAAITGSFIAGSALAADLPSRVEAPVYIPPPAFSWTGFYIGIEGGDVGGFTHWTYNPVPAGPPVGFASHESNGGMIGGTVGYNYQFSPYIVAGLEADFAWADINGITACPNPTFGCQSRISDLGTARGRLGWVPVDRVLLYVTGGLAWGEVDIRTINNAGGPVVPSGTPINGSSSMRIGWTVGAGAEWAVWQSVSLKFEYLRYELGTSTFNVDNPAIQNVSAREDGNLFKFGLNYKFDWAPPPPPAPVIAKY